jgi:hypothetical protein
MKNSFWAAIVFVVFFGTCASMEVSAAPRWVKKPPKSNNFIYGIGAAKMSTPGASTAIAETRARVSLANAISGSLIDRMIQIRIISKDDPTIERLRITFRERLVQAQLSGAKIVKREEMPDGTVWVLLSLPIDEAKKAASAALGEYPNRQLVDKAFLKTKVLPVEK